MKSCWTYKPHLRAGPMYSSKIQNKLSGSSAIFFSYCFVWSFLLNLTSLFLVYYGVRFYLCMCTCISYTFSFIPLFVYSGVCLFIYLFISKERERESKLGTELKGWGGSGRRREKGNRNYYMKKSVFK